MVKKPVRSTVFRLRDRPSKEEQEGWVAQLFAEGYEQATGIRFEDNVNIPASKQPPDWLFFYQGLKIGVEMFQLEQFYKARARSNDLLNAIYSEFARREASERYDGVVISLCEPLRIDTWDRLKSRWQEKGIKRKAIPRFATELVGLIEKYVPSRNCIPNGDRLLVVPVDPELCPAISALAKNIVVARCRSDDSRRTDGKAAPLVIMSPGYKYDVGEIEGSIEKSMLTKMEARPNWVNVDHSVLVAHDVPRGEVYEGHFVEWNDCLARAASRLNLLQAFDEFWLVRPFRIVTAQDNIGDKARRICGEGLS